MNRRLFIYITAVFLAISHLFSCKENHGTEDDVRHVAERFAQSFFTWQLADALQVSDDDMKLRIRFLASNVHKADLRVLHEATETPTIEIGEISMENDSSAQASVSLRNVYQMDTLGTEMHMKEEAQGIVSLRLTREGWRICGVTVSHSKS